MTFTDTQPIERVLKTSEVARHLNCTQDTIYNLIRAGQLRAIRVGRLVRIPESALADFIAGDATLPAVARPQRP